MKISNEEKRDPYSSLRFQDFRYFLVARFVSVFAIQMQAVVVGWLVYEKTKDPLSLGLIGLCEVVPAISVALYAGHIADKTDRRFIIVTCIIGLLLCYLALVGLSLPSYNSSVWEIYLVIFFSGIVRGFLVPSLSAFAAQLVPKDIFPNAATWNSTAWQIAAVGGPALGGAIYGFFDATHTFSIVAILICISLFLFLRVSKKEIPKTSIDDTISERLFSGIRYVFRNQIILGALTLDLFAVLFGGAVALLPIFAGEILMVGPEGLGLLRASPSIGASIMAVFLAYKPPLKKAGKFLLFSVAGFGVCMILFALSKSFFLSVFILAVSGMLDMVSVVIRSTVVQTNTPENMRGRVSAVNSIFIGSSNELGAFESGVAAKLLGTVPSVIFGGAITVLVVIISSFKAPKLRNLNLKDDIW
ncbi:MAG: MFS transporter [Leptospiraceae bacterium]|nr:MFS transporter [Leptospiraceae bacterium]MCK6382371.1 MFS transporter [Leptospiraceae bacterium]NUM40711.1 MFS transporter [Leptospiraceae bacterium]